MIILGDSLGGFCMALIFQYYINSLNLTFIPTVLFTLFCLRHLYDEVNLVSKIKGVIVSICTSYFVLYSFQYVLIILLQKIVQSIYTPRREHLLILSFLVYLFSGILFSICFTKSIRWRNHLQGVKRKIKPLFGIFIYTQYATMIYVSYIFSSSELMYDIFIMIIVEIWYLTFRKNFEKMSYIYPEKRISATNVCLMFEYMVVIMLWFLISFLDSGKMAENHFFWNWLSLLSIIMYVFSLFIHTVIFKESLSEYNEIQILNTDSLTGLATRGYFMEQGQKILSEAIKDDVQLGIIFINITHFKYFNQNYGKEIGDAILCEVSRSLQKNFEKDALISRLSDDHFAVITKIIPDIFGKLSRIEKDIFSIEKCLKAQLLSGVYLTDGKIVDINSALDSAMIACNSNELTHNLNIRFYDEEIYAKEKLNLYVLENIDRAIKENYLKVYYQPIIDVSTEQLTSGEALIRWFDDTYGVIPPNKFIPPLEEQNLIYKIDCFVIEQVCKDQRYLLDNGYKVYPVGFNISRKDFFNVDMVSFIEDMINTYDIPRALIKIEITESAFTNNDRFIADQIERFVRLGYKVWMDDFGSGYSSLNTLGNFHFAGIKLDLAFLKDLTDAKKQLIHGVVKTAKQLGLEVLTEGVECEEHINLLKAVGCDQAQGYMFSMPLSLEDHIKNNTANINQNSDEAAK